MHMRLRKLLGTLFAAASLSATAAIPTTETAELVEFYNASLDHYFITTTAKEISDLDTGVHPGWARTGYRFLVIKPGSTYAGSVPVCRFYGRPDKGIDSHFYSAKASECEDVKNKFPDTWVFETGEAFRAFPVNSDGTCSADIGRVNRLYNNRPDVNHRYTDQPSVFFYMVGKGYTPEGDGNPNFPIAFCAPTGGSVVPPPAPGAPDCAVTASSLTPALGSTLTLNAQCTNAPTKYVWAGCTSTTATCQTTQSTAGSKNYTLYASNAAGPAPDVTIGVNWGGTPGSLPICTIGASSSVVTTGTPLVLTANCSQSPSRYEWYECDYLIQSICSLIPACPATSSSCTVNRTNAGYGRYAVSGGNASGTGPKATVDVEWRQGSGGGGGGGGGTDPIPVCSLLASNYTPTVGTQVVLSASCTGNPTAFIWSGLTCSAIQCATTSSASGMQTYSVSASNAAGTGAVAYVAVNWQSGAPVPSCTLSASNPTPPTGSTVTISASCTNSPTSFVWSGCTSNGPNCTDTLAVAGAKEYTLVASNGAGAGAVASVTVQWTGPVTAVPVCTIAATSTTPTVGQNITLTATCNGSPSSYVWTGTGTACSATSPTCVVTSATAGSATYFVAGTNSIGTGAAAGIPVTWQPSGGGGGGGDFCGSYPSVIRVQVEWGDYKRYTTGSLGGFDKDAVLVFSIVVPATPTSYSALGYTSLAEFQGDPAMRHMTLSKSACDFRPVDPTGANGPYEESYGKQVTIYWNVGAPPHSLEPGRTYHFSVRNRDYTGASDCSSVCNAGISAIWPHN